MSANPIDDNTTPKATGSLEDLFRHHLGEEAAVPPRPMLWDQIDNSLLVRQNETYRKRLTATRWVAAASLLLATLAGTGWWAQHDGGFRGAEVAKVTAPAASRNGQLAGSSAASSSQDETVGSRLNGVASQSATAAMPGSTARGTVDADAASENGLNSRASAPAYAANGAPAGTGFGAASVRGGFERPARAAAGRNSGTDAARRTAYSARFENNSSAIIAQANPTSTANNGVNAATEAGLTAAGTLPASATSATEAASTGLAPAATDATAASVTETTLAQNSAAASPQQVGLLATRPAALSLLASTALPKGLPTVALPEPTPAADFGKWHYGLSYAASVFNPNVNFSRAGIEPEFDYNPALGPDSPKLTEAAAAQYRENLRPGLSQRLALLATRHLKGHWSASTGLEFSQSTAQSASTAAFVGEQLYDLGPFTNGKLRTTDFQYRMGSVPLQVSYSNPVKRGWSLYGRLGGVVSALLGVRSAVEGEPEATKTYSVLSAGMPYRRVLGSVRGAAGAQFRPAVGHWALTLGPTAELGLTPLNAHPAQSFMAQSRPYSFGMEAGVEFGR
ncbi:hypothetical protein [Hymenobacter properus]|uniref:Outer membrane protein beta-barrel domain-containing protein n=1 Tax=Hymenobacter properus TaxID=2791026 RepID=A0A931FK25_9BACT|nr:hypothetical protein [Hymenobacter properus]MBF9141225.1 hypothetical protein [Hymenobacter properus]MBR7720034.1 hypothetical protein [Microvirga sp. SRT04]